MQLVDFQSMVRYRLGNRTNFPADRIVLEMQLAQKRLERRPQLPWFLFAFDQSLPTVAAQDYVLHGTGFLRESEELGGLWYVDSTGQWKPLIKDDYNILKSRTFTPGIPTRYANGKDRFYLFATPDAIYDLRWAGFVSDDLPLVSSPTTYENLWMANAENLLIAEVCLALGRQTQMTPDQIQGFMGEVAMYRLDLEDETLTREEAWKRSVMGGPDAGSLTR